MNSPGSRFLRPAIRWLGAGTTTPSAAELAVATIGSIIAMAVVFTVSYSAPVGGNLLIVASAGASTVLIFAVPHGRLSQPWPVLVGHCLCAAIGVACARWIGIGPVEAAATIGVCILGMSIFRCIHPPAGATALTAVMGGPAIYELGFGFVFSPVLINMATLILVAILINLPFRWRRYPASIRWQRRQPLPPNVNRADIQHALSQIDTLMDVSEDDLMRIYELARQKSDGAELITRAHIVTDLTFSNGKFGASWQVREIISRELHTVRYEIIAGQRVGDLGEISIEEFIKWAAYPVIREGDSWSRIRLDDKN
jgi:CBS-domain-containing membrane protein